MEARIFPVAATAAVRLRRSLLALLLVALLFGTMGASARSRNFVVQTADPALARQIADAAEKYRRELAVSWLGQAMPDWSAPCVMTVQVGPGLGAGGATTFMFDRGEVFGWRMSIQGSRERLFDSVLPHEITHMILASHFRRPLPRWADEGAATSTECAGEREKHYRMLREFLCTRRGIPFATMFAMTEYPPDVMPLYAQGFSLADYLIQQGGRRKFLAFLGNGLNDEQWSAALQRHYGSANLGQLQNDWLAWIRQGHPAIPSRQAMPETSPEVLLASAQQPLPARSGSVVAPKRSVRTPSSQLATAGRRPWPKPNLIYHVPRSAAADVALASSIGPSTGMVAPTMTENPPVVGLGPRKLVPVVYPGDRGADSSPASPPASARMARPQSPETARQVVLEWSKPGEPVPTPTCGEGCCRR